MSEEYKEVENRINETIKSLTIGIVQNQFMINYLFQKFGIKNSDYNRVFKECSKLSKESYEKLLKKYTEKEKMEEKKDE